MPSLSLFPVKLLLCTISLISIQCQENNQHSTPPDSNQPHHSITELVDKEQANQQNARNGNRVIDIKTITDPREVTRLRQYIISQQKQATQKALASQPGNKDIVDQLKEGNKTVIPAIIAQLKAKDARRRKEIYAKLQKGYGELPVTNTDQALIKQLLLGIDDPEDESDAIQLAGANKIPGYAKSMEAHLLSGKNTDQGIYFWLGEDGKSTAALDHIIAGIKKNIYTGDTLKDVIQGLYGYTVNGSPQTQQKAAHAAWFIYEQQLVPRQEFEAIKSNIFSFNQAEMILILLLTHGDKRVVPLAQHFYHTKARTGIALQALIRLEGKKYMDSLYALLGKHDEFMDGLETLEELDKQYFNETVFKALIQGFAMLSDKKDFVASRIVNVFIKQGATQHFTNITKYTNNTEAINLLKRAWRRQNTSPDEVFNDLIQLGLMPKRPADHAILRAKLETDNPPIDLVFTALDLDGPYIQFDTETDELPMHYDTLLSQFARKSQGVLKDMLVWLDATQQGDQFPHTVTIVLYDTAYIVTPGFIGDWYDMPCVEATLDVLLSQVKSAKRFISMNTGDQTARYFFGEPEKVKAFLEKYEYSVPNL